MSTTTAPAATTPEPASRPSSGRTAVIAAVGVRPPTRRRFM